MKRKRGMGSTEVLVMVIILGFFLIAKENSPGSTWAELGTLVALTVIALERRRK